MRIGAVIAALMATCAPAGAMAAEKKGPPDFDMARHGEDYSYLRDPANRTGAWWEPLKFIPLDASGARYLTLGAESRVRYEHFVDRNWGDPPAPTQGYGWFRVMPHADLHDGPNARLFGQLIGAWAVGMEPGPSPVDETGVDLLQAFAQFRFPDGDWTMTARGGRQMMAYGSQRLIGTRYIPNVLQAFDGGLLRFETGRWRTDAFYTRPVRNQLHDFDDSADDTQQLWSLYATRSPAEGGRNSGLDLFYIGYTNSAAVYEQGSGAESRYTLGARLFGGRGNWTWDDEAHFQFGNFAGGGILAWSVATDTRYTFTDSPMRPYIQLRADAISGDLDPNDDELNSFNALFPRGRYFADTVGPRNLFLLYPEIGVELSATWSVHGSAAFYWRESLGDGVYNIAGNLIRGSDNNSARFIGTQTEIALGWTPVRGVEFRAAASLFEPGRFIEETGPSETTKFVGAEANLRF